MKHLVNGSLKQTIQDLLSAADDDKLMELLHELQPFDIATVLMEFEEPDRLKILALSDPDIAAETLEHLDYDDQYSLLDHSADQVTRDLLARMSDDAVADLLLAIHPRQAQEILRRVPKEDIAGIKLLMTYPADSAGGIMTLDYIAVREDWNVNRVINHFRKVGSKATVTNYIYVVDGQGRLVGVTSLKEVLLSDPRTLVSDIMYTKVVSVPVEAHQQEAAKLVSSYDFVALPVTDNTGRLVGVIAVDDILDVIEEEDTEDIHRLGGSLPLDEPYLNSSMFDLIKKRIGWLLVLFMGQGFTGNILKSYEDVLAQVVALTFFIPLLTDTGGNSGSQASTLVIRAMALGEVTLKDLASILWKEVRIGGALGLVMGTVGFTFSWVVGGSQAVALTVGITLVVIMIVSSTIGAVLPLIGSRFGVDPAVLSAPLVTTIVDTTGLIIYFAVATRILKLG
ncbi:MAG: magnesium transporter [Bacillota bacterium]